jgi:branched-chain amino acid transport system permease protein
VMALVLVFKPNGLFGKPFSHPRTSEVIETPLGKPSNIQYGALLVGVLLLAALPYIFDDYTSVLATDIAIFALFAASLGLIIGTAGLGSFGHAAYFGLGAYGAAIAAKAEWGFVASLLSGVSLAAFAAIVFGWFCVRLSGTYMAMLTLAFAQIVWSIVFQWDAVTGGSNGIVGVWPPEMFSNRDYFYWVTLALCGAGVLLCWWIVYTPFGYALRASRDSRVKAQAIGLNVMRLQWAGFAIAGALAGVAGAVYAFSKGSISPDVSAIPRSVDALVMVLLGGINTLLGPVVGAAVFTWLADTLTRVTDYWRALLGAIILLLVMVFPRGIVGSVKVLIAKFAPSPAARERVGVRAME